MGLGSNTASVVCVITVTFETRYLRGSNRTTGLVELDEVPITIDERIAALEANKTSIDIPMWRYVPPPPSSRFSCYLTEPPILTNSTAMAGGST